MSGTRIGTVSHFFDRISVAVIELTGKLRLGDTVHFLGTSTDFKQEVTSLQIEHQTVSEAGPGEVAMKTIQPAHPNAAIFKITSEE